MNNSSNPLPSLEQAKKYADFIKEPKNGQIVVLNSVAPMKLSTGADIDKTSQESLQKKLNRQGMLIVHSSHSDYPEGEKVLLNQHPQFNLTRVVTSTELYENFTQEVKENVINKTGSYKMYSETALSAFYKKYVIIVLHPTQIACTLT